MEEIRHLIWWVTEAWWWPMMYFRIASNVLFVESPLALRQDATRCQWVNGLLSQGTRPHFHTTLLDLVMVPPQTSFIILARLFNLTKPHSAFSSTKWGQYKPFFPLIIEITENAYQTQNRHSINFNHCYTQVSVTKKRSNENFKRWTKVGGWRIFQFPSNSAFAPPLPGV